MWARYGSTHLQYQHFEVEVGGSGVHGHFHINRELQVSLGYVRHCLKKLQMHIKLFLYP